MWEKVIILSLLISQIEKTKKMIQITTHKMFNISLFSNKILIEAHYLIIHK
jgi:hypothetical protein